MSGYVNEDGTSNTYSTLKRYITEIRQIINSSGLFKEHFEDVITQVDSINNMTEQFNSAIVSSLKRDIIDIMNKTTDWDDFHKKLSVDIKNKVKPFNYKFETFKFNIDTADQLDNEVITNMNLIMDDINIDSNNIELSAKKNKKKINMYNEYKNAFEQDMDDFLQNILDCENKAVKCRNENVEKMKKNIDILYKIHAKYAYNLLHKIKNNITSIEYTNDKGKIINIPLCKSQTKFITDAIKMMLEID